jgi:hypothetical protein
LALFSNYLQELKGYPVLTAGFALALRASAASYGDQTMSNLTPSLTWRGRIASLCLALLLAVGIAARAIAFPNPQDSVRSFYDTLLTTMKAGPTLGERGRYARLAPVIDRLFDVPAMARLAVGPSWETLSPTQQQLILPRFGGLRC